MLYQMGTAQASADLEDLIFENQTAPPSER